MKRCTTIALVFSNLVAGGCAATGDLRALANMTADFTETYQSATKEFADLQNELAVEDNRRIAGIKAAGLEADADSQTLVQGWVLTNTKASKDNLERYRLMAKPSAAELLAAMTAPPASQSSTLVSAPKLAEQVKSLREIGEVPGLIDQAKFLATFGQAVSKRAKELQDEAHKAASAASDEADAKAVGVAMAAANASDAAKNK